MVILEMIMGIFKEFMWGRWSKEWISAWYFDFATTYNLILANIWFKKRDPHVKVGQNLIK